MIYWAPWPLAWLWITSKWNSIMLCHSSVTSWDYHSKEMKTGMFSLLLFEKTKYRWISDFVFLNCMLGKLKIHFFWTPNRFIKVTKIGTVVILTFVCCWMPFLTGADSILQVLHRLFPFARGLFEVRLLAIKLWRRPFKIFNYFSFFCPRVLITDKSYLMFTMQQETIPSFNYLLFHNFILG